MSHELLEHIEGGIATLTLNRPEARNAMTRPMLIELERNVLLPAGFARGK